MAVGFLAVGLGSLGVIVPGLPTTGFFVLAAWAFARSSPRFERWVLSLPMVGQLVKDSRAGLGMPRRAKVIAISMMVVAVGLSAGLALSWWPARLIVAGGRRGGRLVRRMAGPHPRAGDRGPGGGPAGLVRMGIILI